MKSPVNGNIKGNFSKEKLTQISIQMKSPVNGDLLMGINPSAQFRDRSPDFHSDEIPC
jgi:hypothetical protein